MPRGITQEQVDTAADALLQLGERATVEKVRASLGTGSPNTVTRMLDAWRQGLAERLRKVSELPELPDEVGAAMTSTWALALQHARTRTQHEVEAEREALEHSRTALDAREAERAALLVSNQEATQRAEEAARRAVVETTALRRLVDRLETEAKTHSEDRARLLAQNQTLETTCTQLREEIRTAAAKLAKERTARDEHVKAIEDRAHAEVDRVRIDLKTTYADLIAARKHHQAEVRALQNAAAELTRSLGVAEREAAHQRGVAEALKLKLPSAEHKKEATPNRHRSRTAGSLIGKNADVRADHARRQRP